MKTLDDAMKTPGVIEPGGYETGWGCGSLAGVAGLVGGGVELKGAFMPKDLRRIADHLDPQPVAAPLEVGYTNWRGEWAMRRIRPIRLWVGSTYYHPEPGLLLEALDLDRGETRHFAVKDFGLRREAQPVAAPASDPGKPDSSPVIPEGWRLVPVGLRAVPQKIAFEILDAAQNFRNGGCEIETLLAGLPTIPLRTEAQVRAEALKDWPKFCETLGVDPALSMGQVAAHVYGKAVSIRAEARREALEEAARECDALATGYGRGHDYASEAAECCAKLIRTMIEKDPTNGDTP